MKNPEQILLEQIDATETLIKIAMAMPPCPERLALAGNIEKLMANHREAVGLLENPAKMH